MRIQRVILRCPVFTVMVTGKVSWKQKERLDTTIPASIYSNATDLSNNLNNPIYDANQWKPNMPEPKKLDQYC